MFGISYYHLLMHFLLNLIIASVAVLFLGFSNNYILFYLLLSVFFHSLITDLLPHRTSGLKKMAHIAIEEYLPMIVVLFLLVMASANSIPVKPLFTALIIVVLFSLLLKGLFCIVREFLPMQIAQLVAGITALIFLLGIFLVPSLMVLTNNYETKNRIYLFFAQINPLIILSNLFGEDPFHKEQLYHYFGSNFLVPKLDGVDSMIILGLCALIFWLLYAFWGGRESSTNPS